MEYIILTQGVPADTGNHSGVARALELDVLLYLHGGWRPIGGPTCGQVNGRFVVMQAMTREVQKNDDDR